jgi:hypothetical protein
MACFVQLQSAQLFERPINIRWSPGRCATDEAESLISDEAIALLAKGIAA